jgi:hypothetical protein
MSDELSFYMQLYERRGYRREVQTEIELVPQGQDGSEDQQT